MINVQKIENIIVNGLQEEMGCPVILANQTESVPSYPYLNFIITTPVVSNTMPWSVDENNIYYKSLNQVWSFTSKSDDHLQAQMKILSAYDWFSHNGCTYLSDNEIIVVKVDDIINKDYLLNTGYEYRYGFDVHFSLRHISKSSQGQTEEVIEKVPLNYEEV